MLRGTRMLDGEEAKMHSTLVSALRLLLLSADYEEVIIPAIWEQKTFIDKAGKELLSQMWAFKDKGGREVCLIPEATAIIQEVYNNSWSKSKPKPVRVFYVTRCYRYEKPQEGRYREFTQIGIEILGGDMNYTYHEAVALLLKCMDSLEINYELKPNVKRGLSYYIEDGFEIECASLGAQKQIAGGGKYKEGVGWAIGLERLLLAKVKG